MITFQCIDKMKEREFLDIVRKMPVFTTRQSSALIGSRDYAKVFLHRLARRGLIRRLVRGRYTVHEDPMAYSTHVYYPSYISLLNAFQYHGTTTQLPTMISVMASMNRTIEGVEYIRTRNMWGYRLVRYGDLEIFMADLEKAVIDAISTERVPLDEVQRAIGMCDIARLEVYALRLPASSIRRVGYVAETAGHYMNALFESVKDDRNYSRYRHAEAKNRWRLIHNRQG